MFKNKFKRLDKSESGFTIVELIIVIAIAALILTIALAVVPALRRSGRNSARNSDRGAITAQLLEYAGNNGNRLPARNTASSSSTPASIQTEFTNRIIGQSEQSHVWDNANIADGSGLVYYLYSGTGSPTWTNIEMPGQDDLQFFEGAQCAVDEATAAAAAKYQANGGPMLEAGTTTSIAVVYHIEGDQSGATNNVIQCRDDVQ